MDWVAIPLVPYLYSVENPEEVPAHVDKDLVNRGPDRLAALTASGGADENPESAQISIQVQAPRAAESGFAETPAYSATFGLKEMTAAHEQ